MNNTMNDAKIFTDMTGVSRLRYQTNTDEAGARKEVAQQFEAILMQLVMKSMRDAGGALKSDLFSSNEMELYQDLFDKQLSLSMSDQSMGFAKMIEDNILQQNSSMTKQNHPSNQVNQLAAVNTQHIVKDKNPNQVNSIKKQSNATQESFSSPQEFISKLLPLAKNAAQALGLNPAILVAQAALETNWGKKIISDAHGLSSYNLFNIKADSNSSQAQVQAMTLEERHGLLSKEKASFRRYVSFEDSFSDYVKLLKNNSRYETALKQGAHPEKFIKELQNAGYATDSQYAQKVMGIFKSNSFKEFV